MAIFIEGVELSEYKRRLAAGEDPAKDQVPDRHDNIRSAQSKSLVDTHNEAKLTAQVFFLCVLLADVFLYIGAGDIAQPHEFGYASYIVWYLKGHLFDFWSFFAGAFFVNLLLTFSLFAMYGMGRFLYLALTSKTND